MTEQLLRKAFEKAAKESGKDSLHGKAEFLSEKLLEEAKFQVSGKSLTRYVKNEFPPKKEVLDHLAHYLGFTDYQDFMRHHPANGIPQRTRKRSYQKLLNRSLFFPLIAIAAYMGYEAGEEECMVWRGDHYEQISCSGAPEEEAYDPAKIQGFRKVAVSDSLAFFKEGQPNVWYYKNEKGLELYSAPGLHPENGKTLKPITSYMIDKYLHR